MAPERWDRSEFDPKETAGQTAEPNDQVNPVQDEQDSHEATANTPLAQPRPDKP